MTLASFTAKTARVLGPVPEELIFSAFSFHLQYEDAVISIVNPVRFLGLLLFNAKIVTQ